MSNHGMGQKQKRKLKSRLFKLQGKSCFYCQHPMKDEEATIEHLLPVCRGGTNSLANLALAHEPCNHLASNKTIYEKVMIRERFSKQSIDSHLTWTLILKKLKELF